MLLPFGTAAASFLKPSLDAKRCVRDGPLEGAGEEDVGLAGVVDVAEVAAAGAVAGVVGVFGAAAGGAEAAPVRAGCPVG